MPDLLAPWIDVYNTAAENATTLIDNFALAPGVGLQQALVNQTDLWQQFFNDPTSSTFASVMEQMQSNLDAVLQGVGLQNVDMTYEAQGGGWASPIAATVTEHTTALESNVLFGEVPGYLPASEAWVAPIIAWLGSPESAIVIGTVGPLIAPWVELYNCITAGDDLNTTLADVMGAFFNGADLNLDSLVPTIDELAAGHFPVGMSMTELDIGFGGLLSTGSVLTGPYDVLGSGGDVVASIPAVGGSIFNNVGLNFTGVPVLGNLTLTSEPIGPIGAWEELSQTIGALLGSGWSSYNEPVDVTAPGIGITLPTLLSDLFGESSGSAASAATDLSSLVQDVASLF